MSIKEIKEMIAVEIQKMLYSSIKRCEPEDIVEMIFTLRYPCEECGGKGTGLFPDKDFKNFYNFTQCPICKGTGSLLDKDGKPIKVVVIQSPEQELSKAQPLGDSSEDCAYDEGYHGALRDMTTPKDGKVWAEIYTGR